MGRFGRVAEALEAAAAAKVRDCQTNGSKHSVETMTDLSDLVNSFIENGNGILDTDFDTRIKEECNSEGIDNDVDEMKERLKRLFGFENGGDERRNVILEVEKAWRHVIKDGSSPSTSEFKRRFMARLRDQGLEAGLCKSKWENKGRLVAGDYEYVDVNIGGTRYMIIVSLLEEFKIARPTENYTSMLEIFPQIAVCKVEEFKEIVRIMCKAIKKSMNQMKMSVPPWRRRKYVQAKWFGSYKRTTNEFPTKNTTHDLNINKKKIVGFITTPGTCYGGNNEHFARDDLVLRKGNLAMAMAMNAAS